MVDTDYFNFLFDQLNVLFWNELNQHMYIADVKSRDASERKDFVLKSAYDVLEIRQKDLQAFKAKHREFFKELQINL